MNPHIDAVQLVHAGRTVTVRFTWRALETLQREWGEGWGERFVTACTTENVADLAELMAVATGMTADEVKDWCPPTQMTAQALWDAYAFVKLGRKDSEAEAGENDPANPRLMLGMASKASAVLRYVRGLAGRRSGTVHPTPPASTSKPGQTGSEQTAT